MGFVAFSFLLFAGNTIKNVFHNFIVKCAFMSLDDVLMLQPQISEQNGENRKCGEDDQQ